MKVKRLFEYKMGPEFPLGLNLEDSSEGLTRAVHTLAYMEKVCEGCNPRYLKKLKNHLIYNEDIQVTAYIAFIRAIAESKTLGMFLMSLFESTYKEMTNRDEEGLSQLVLNMFEMALDNVDRESTVYAFNIMIHEYYEWTINQRSRELAKEALGGFLEHLGFIPKEETNGWKVKKNGGS